MHTVMHCTQILFYRLKNPHEDTEWNDVLRAKGIIGPKEVEISEDQVVDMIEQTIAEKSESESQLPASS